MYTELEKSQEFKNTADKNFKNKSIGSSSAKFIDNRTDTIVQRRLLEITHENRMAKPSSEDNGMSQLYNGGFPKNMNLVQLYRTKTQKGQDGEFIPAYDAAIHCHIGRKMRSPHLKIKNERYNFGVDYNQRLMQTAYEALIRGGNENLEGYSDCKEYLEEQGCRAPVLPTLIDIGLEQGQYPPRLQRGTGFKDAEGHTHSST